MRNRASPDEFLFPILTRQLTNVLALSRTLRAAVGGCLRQSLTVAARVGALLVSGRGTSRPACGGVRFGLRPESNREQRKEF
jgi:hypothetical protein